MPPKTKTLPESLRDASYDGPDVATMIQSYDTDLRFELSREKTTYTLGSAPGSDIAIRDEFVSALHCLVQRRGSGMRIYDQSSSNGTYFDGRRVDVFDIRPGDTFTAGRTRLLLLNDEMQAANSVLSEILGSADEGTLTWSSGLHSSPCGVMVAAMGGANLVITGDKGCEQSRLAETIHAISLRRGRELVHLDRELTDRAAQRAIIDRASRATLVLTIHEDTPVMDATFVSMLFSPSRHIRVITIAPSVQKARDVLGEMSTATMRLVSLAPIAQRPGAVPRLLDRLFADRGVDLRVSDLTSANQAALQAYSWPENLSELRFAADRFIEIAREGSVKAGAEKLGVPTSSMHYWYGDQLGLSSPFLAHKAGAPQKRSAAHAARK